MATSATDSAPATAIRRPSGVASSRRGSSISRVAARTAASDGATDHGPGTAAPRRFAVRTEVASAFIRQLLSGRAVPCPGPPAAYGSPHQERGADERPGGPGKQHADVLVAAVQRLRQTHHRE